MSATAHLGHDLLRAAGWLLWLGGNMLIPRAFQAAREAREPVTHWPAMERL